MFIQLENKLINLAFAREIYTYELTGTTWENKSHIIYKICICFGDGERFKCFDFDTQAERDEIYEHIRQLTTGTKL